MKPNERTVCKDWRNSAPESTYEILGNLPGTILKPFYEMKGLDPRVRHDFLD